MRRAGRQSLSWWRRWSLPCFTSLDGEHYTLTKMQAHLAKEIFGVTSLTFRMTSRWPHRRRGGQIERQTPIAVNPRERPRGERAREWARENMGRDDGLRWQLPNWTGCHMPDGPLPYLEGVKTGQLSPRGHFNLSKHFLRCLLKKLLLNCILNVPVDLLIWVKTHSWT